MSGHKIRFKYSISDNYTPKYINGAYGGITPRGEIVVNFFFERNDMPVSQEYSVTPDGKLGSEMSSVPEDVSSTICRHVETGIILTLNSAKELSGWLNEKIAILEKNGVDPKDLN